MLLTARQGKLGQKAPGPKVFRISGDPRFQLLLQISQVGHLLPPACRFFLVNPVSSVSLFQALIQQSQLQGTHGLKRVSQLIQHFKALRIRTSTRGVE